MIAAILVAVIGGIIAWNGPTEATQRGATLLVASMALLVTVLNALVNAFIAPEDQLRLDRRKRREQRLEDAAAEISGYFGVKGSQLLGQLDDAWSARDWAGVQDRAGHLASMAERCFELADGVPDELQILIGVVWVEAGDVRDGAGQLAGIPEHDWDAHDVGQHLQNVRDYYTRIDSRLFQILAPDQRRPLS
jgi:hypothetical protein